MYRLGESQLTMNFSVYVGISCTAKDNVKLLLSHYTVSSKSLRFADTYYVFVIVPGSAKWKCLPVPRFPCLDFRSQLYRKAKYFPILRNNVMHAINTTLFPERIMSHERREVMSFEVILLAYPTRSSP